MGAEAPLRNRVLSTPDPLLAVAATTPSSPPSAIASAIDAAMSSSVTGKKRPTSLITDRLVRIDWPRFPRTASLT